MHLSRYARLLPVAAIAAVTLAAPAEAQEPVPPYPASDWEQRAAYPSQYRMDPRVRDEWLTECRRRMGGRDDGVGGALIGGLVGGVAGNRIAGRGNRTIGTVAGAAVGAAAGMAIDKAEDRRDVRDECERYLDDYYAQAGHHYGYGQGYAPYGHAAGGCCQMQPMMAVPMAHRGEPQCTETVEYEYEDVPVRYSPPPRPAPQKRIKVVPDKRIKTAPDKRLRN
ncbi:hypothetical protein GCM10011371_15410 [Novosphingobium marinum]|uniref:17 kDa surface antigen n=1 Tax=Novosphingobium marinum TaxID=1514948 RepID=A0A7Y9XW24_9SPHN|nr:glycine zipper 2TM domain-containing protein [Novosphingobium marinum]NYH95654.1 uncharacterized protein YcfJ [Novosphingobium marinum]GGC28746.1 hypothetical protein GCM10011371_15410 [Novosphingobium marinum]